MIPTVFLEELRFFLLVCPDYSHCSQKAIIIIIIHHHHRRRRRRRHRNHRYPRYPSRSNYFIIGKERSDLWISWIIFLASVQIQIGVGTYFSCLQWYKQDYSQQHRSKPNVFWAFFGQMRVFSINSTQFHQECHDINDCAIARLYKPSDKDKNASYY